MIKAMALWITGLATLVPYGIYRLLFVAEKDEYALLITGVLFWVFGYWGMVGPLLAALRVHTLFRAIDACRTTDELRTLLLGKESEEAAIDLIASENRLPRFLAKRVYKFILKRFQETDAEGRLNRPGSSETAS